MRPSLSTVEAKRRGEDPEHIWSMLAWILIFGIIGARLYHVFSNPVGGLGWSWYREHPIDIIAFWNGGFCGLALVSLFAAGLVMTALNPLTLWDVGFQLSFLTTLSLVLFATPMTERFERLMNRLSSGRAAKPMTGFLNDALIVTLAAQILTLPLIAHYCGRLSVVSPPANLLVLPVQPAVMIWGGAGVILSLLSTLPPRPRGLHSPPSSYLSSASSWWSPGWPCTGPLR